MDFNGVIIDDEPIQLQAYREILAAEGVEISDADYLSRLGMDDKTFVASLLEVAGKSTDIDHVIEITKLKTDKWRAIVSADVPLFDGVENFVRKMSKELTLGIVSMAKREEIDFDLEKTGIAECFSIVVSAEDVTKCKPDPECYRAGFRIIDLARIAAGHLPMIHADCLVIEDSPPGVAAGRGADLQVLGITNTVTADELRAAGAGAVTKHLNDWMPDSVRRVFA